MTPMRVIEVSTCPHTSRPMVMLQVEGRDRWLAFYIPMNEANRLARCLGMTECPCTPIFELTEQLIGHLQAEVRRAHLEGDERGISAGLVVERDGREMMLPCHPA
jgi:bifunctional DNase/RNase